MLFLKGCFINTSNVLKLKFIGEYQVGTKAFFDNCKEESVITPI